MADDKHTAVDNVQPETDMVASQDALVDGVASAEETTVAQCEQAAAATVETGEEGTSSAQSQQQPAAGGPDSMLQDLFKGHSSEIGNWCDIVGTNQEEPSATPESFRSHHSVDIPHDGPFFVFASNVAMTTRFPDYVKLNLYRHLGAAQNLFGVHLYQVPRQNQGIGCCMLMAKSFESCLQVLRMNGKDFCGRNLKLEYVVSDRERPKAYPFTESQLDQQMQRYKEAHPLEEKPKRTREDIFGSARCVDTNKKIQEMEAKMAEERAKDLKKLQADSQAAEVQKPQVQILLRQTTNNPERHSVVLRDDNRWHQESEKYNRDVERTDQTGATTKTTDQWTRDQQHHQQQRHFHHNDGRNNFHSHQQQQHPHRFDKQQPPPPTHKRPFPQPNRKESSDTGSNAGATPRNNESSVESVDTTSQKTMPNADSTPHTQQPQPFNRDGNKMNKRGSYNRNQPQNRAPNWVPHIQQHLNSTEAINKSETSSVGKGSRHQSVEEQGGDQQRPQKPPHAARVFHNSSASGQQNQPHSNYQRGGGRWKPKGDGGGRRHSAKDREALPEESCAQEGGEKKEKVEPKERQSADEKKPKGGEEEQQNGGQSARGAQEKEQSKGGNKREQQHHHHNNNRDKNRRKEETTQQATAQQEQNSSAAPRQSTEVPAANLAPSASNNTGDGNSAVQQQMNAEEANHPNAGAAAADKQVSPPVEGSGDKNAKKNIKKKNKKSGDKKQEPNTPNKRQGQNAGSSAKEKSSNRYSVLEGMDDNVSS